MSATTAPALLAVVDDDESVRESLPDLLRQCGFQAAAFASAGDFLASAAINQTACLILDIAMPGMSGIDLQRELEQLGHSTPIVFITAHGDEIDRARLIQGAAVECLLKPFTEQQLLDAISLALESGS